MRNKHFICLFCIVATWTFSANAEASTWVVPEDFATIQEAIDSAEVFEEDTIIVKRGRHSGATVTKAVKIVGVPGAIIDSGPIFVENHPCLGDMRIGFKFGFEGDPSGSGTVIKHLTFDNLAFPVFSRGADRVQVIGCHIINAVQGVTNGGGGHWIIARNRMTNLRAANGGGIGILFGDRYARLGGVSRNAVMNNHIVGTVQVNSCDPGGYVATGVAVYADYRGGAAGAESISDNLVASNIIRLVSDTPSVVDVVGIELTDTRNDSTVDPVIFNNTVIYNSLDHMPNTLEFTPETLEDVNSIWFNRPHHQDDTDLETLKTSRTSESNAGMTCNVFL